MKITNKMQLYRLIYFSLSTLHVSGDVFPHHQEHLTVFTVSASIPCNNKIIITSKDNIKIDLQEVGGGRGDWMELATDRDRWQAFVGTVRNFRVQ
jgi:hypothetical protein